MFSFENPWKNQTDERIQERIHGMFIISDYFLWRQVGKRTSAQSSSKLNLLWYKKSKLIHRCNTEIYAAYFLILVPTNQQSQIGSLVFHINQLVWLLPSKTTGSQSECFMYENERDYSEQYMFTDTVCSCIYLSSTLVYVHDNGWFILLDAQYWCSIILVDYFNPFEKYESNWIISPNRGENK